MDKLKARLDQKDLRRLASERKLNLQKAGGERVNSPLAKYDAQGNLSCVICRSVIKSATVWKVHINSKQHKQNVEEAKGLKEQIIASVKDLSKQQQKGKPVESTSSTATIVTPQTTHTLSRVESQSRVPTFKEPTAPRISHREKEETSRNSQKIEDDKDLTNEFTSLTKKEDVTEGQVLTNEDNESPISSDTLNAPEKSVLPEQFFDAPPSSKAKQDALDEEWEKFQREIKEETMASNEIIAGEHNDATVDRHLIEIDEQMYHWSKVRMFEEKIEQLQKNNNRLRNKMKLMKNGVTKEDDEGCMDVAKEDEGTDDTDTENEETLEDFLDWRCKSIKKYIG